MTNDHKDKPQVKRYDCTSGGAQFCQGCYTMTQDELGDYVTFEDYNTLSAQLSEAQARLAAWPAVKESLTGERELAEYAYSVTAHDFERNPIGSRDWTLFWSGWQRNNEARNEAAPVAPAAQAVAVPDAYQKALDAALSFIGDVAPGASWWDDVWPEHDAALLAAQQQKKEV